MEMGSGSLTESGNSNASSSTTSLSPPPDFINGLKFGGKVYFENAGPGGAVFAPPKSSSGSSSSSRKGGHGGHQQQQPPRCQVEGCKVDLSDAKAYYSRHKVCGPHSKSTTVIVAGLEQRFCQQCSRFHQLPEFDQEKRSCRRRLAGHNERRRKPPAGSVLSSRYGRISSTVFDNSSSRNGGFLVDFSAYSRNNGRDAWAAVRSSASESVNQPPVTGRSLPSPWLSKTPNPPPSNLYLQGSSSGTDFSSSGIPSGECFTGVSIADSSCALSLLSNQQPWGSRNQASGLGMRDLANTQEAPMAQSTPHHTSNVNQYPNHNWGFKINTGGSSGSSSHEMRPDLCLGQIAHFSNELELSQQNTRQYMELDHSRAYDSYTQHMHWSL